MLSKSICVVPVIVVLFVAAPATALLVDWEEAVATTSPKFFATNIVDGLYDIGTYGDDQTYEFVVKSNPHEMEESMCLIGRRLFGDIETWAGLKFEQYVNTGTYGATLFYVQDYDFGIPNAPGVETHLVFVSSKTAGTCSLYVNGVYQASVPTPISLSGPVGIGCGREGADGSTSFDNFDGVIYGIAIYDAILSDSEILSHSDAYFLNAWEVMLPETVLFIMDEVDLGDIAPEIEGSLLVKIDAALAALYRDNANDAKVSMNDLKALINQVNAQTNKKITPEVASVIIQRVNVIIATLGG